MHQSIHIPVQTGSTTVPGQPIQPPMRHQSPEPSEQKLDAQRTEDGQKPAAQRPAAQKSSQAQEEGQVPASQLPQHRRNCAQLQPPTLQQGQRLSESLHQHSQLLDQLGEQSLGSWYRCRESASLTRQRAFAAVDQATTVDAEIAQLNRTIQQQLQQFDAQLKISTQTLQQEVDQKVGQYRRHVQQQSKQFRDRLRLSQVEQSSPAIPQLSPAQKLFQATTLR